MPRKPRWSVHLFLRPAPPTHHLSHGNYKPLLEKITWPKILLENLEEKVILLHCSPQVLTYWGEYEPCCILSLRLLNSLAGWFPENFGNILDFLPPYFPYFYSLAIIITWSKCSLGKIGSGSLEQEFDQVETCFYWILKSHQVTRN